MDVHQGTCALSQSSPSGGGGEILEDRPRGQGVILLIAGSLAILVLPENLREPLEKVTLSPTLSPQPDNYADGSGRRTIGRYG